MEIFFEHFTDRYDGAARDGKAMKLDVAAEAETNNAVICDEEAIESA